MSNRLMKIALPVLAAVGVLAATAPAEARCWWDRYGNRVCSPPPRYYAPPPRYVVERRVYVEDRGYRRGPPPWARHHHRHHRHWRDWD